MTAPSCARPPGEATLVGSWHALAATSRDAVVRDLHGSAVAIFPAWMPLNNAILLDPPTARTAAAAAAALDCEYRAAGVAQWALWLPSARGSFQGTDVVSAITGMTRDTTTVVMTAAVESGLARSPAVLKTSIASATRASDEPTPVADLDEPEGVPGLDGWVLLDGDRAVAGAWSFLGGTDCGIYSVGTAPAWRRRGLARTLLQHILADAHRRGARTASLQSTVMGEPLYAGLGFNAVGRYEEWIVTADG